MRFYKKTALVIVCMVLLMLMLSPVAQSSEPLPPPPGSDPGSDLGPIPPPPIGSDPIGTLPIGSDPEPPLPPVNPPAPEAPVDFNYKGFCTVAGPTGVNLGTGALYRWNPITENYMIANSIAISGIGYYGYYPFLKTLQMSNFETGSFEIQLYPGQNLIGNPFATAVTLPESYQAYVIYNGSRMLSNVLPPGRAGWVYSYNPAIITLIENVQDHEPPTINITSPTNYGIYPAGEMQFLFSAQDEGSDVQYCKGILNSSITSIADSEVVQLGSGIYNFEVIAMDAAGNTASKKIMFIVYDPSAGFATGGGWIVPDPSINEKATFGFVSKYKQGSNVPDGNLEFQYNYGNLNLKSIDQHWMVVSNNSAMFEGTATINGAGSYTYRVDCTDGDNTTDKPDSFTIRIWLGSNIEANPVHAYRGELQGGQIMVHKK